MATILSRLSTDAVYFAEGNPTGNLSEERARQLVRQMLDQLGPLRRVLLIPPDSTRPDAWADVVTRILWEELHTSVEIAILPALGTHRPMTSAETAAMYPGLPQEIFLPHDWRNDVVDIGTIPGSLISQLSEGKLHYEVRAQLNRRLLEETWDAIFSIGQIVPHEVAGIANHNKNIFVGVGGSDIINKSHFLGAVYGMERIMGQGETPVRAVFDYAEENFAAHLPIVYLLTVRAESTRGIVTRGFYAGSGKSCFTQGAELVRACNIHRLDYRPQRVVVYMSPEAYHSTWLANKAIYRTRKAIADAGELLVIAPGVHRFGEKDDIDVLIRRHGYRGTPATLTALEDDPALAKNLSAAAHLIHGSSEGRFQITYSPGQLGRAEMEAVGYRFAPLEESLKRFDPAKLKPGWNSDELGDFYYINHAGLGLWEADG